VPDERLARLWRIVHRQNGAADYDSVAHAICLACVEVVGPADAAAVTLRADRQVEDTVASSAEWATRLEELQFTVGEGPALDAMTRGGPVLVDNLENETARWPAFVDGALEHGAAAAFAFPLQLGAIRLGILSLYGRRAASLDSDGLADAAVLADLATLSIQERASAHKRAELLGLSPPAGSYHDVHLATGMLAALLEVSIDDAFARLRAYAYGANRPLLEVADDVLNRRIPPEEFAE
jgi:transcriptional regulator with GAF, ATPase, and Fis domain